MSNDTPDVDWVAGRIAYSPQRVFDELFDRVSSDVAKANAAEGRANVTIEKKRDNLFSVWDTGNNRSRLRVAADFILDGDEITIGLHLPNRQTDTERTYRLTLDEAGQCRFESQGELLALWQVARWALEDLLFGKG